MPVYTYRCDNCGIQFDKQVSFSDQPPKRCPECGKKSLKKVFQPVGIVFKGSGFYATDHHSPSGQSHIKTDGKTESMEPMESKEPKESKESKEPKESKESKETLSKPEKTSE